MVKLLTVKSCRRKDGVFYTEGDTIEVTDAEAVSLHAAFPGCFEGVGFSMEDENTSTGNLYKLYLEGKFKPAGEMK